MNIADLVSHPGISLSVPAMFALGAIVSPHCGLMCGALSVRQARSEHLLGSHEAVLWTQAGRIAGYAVAGGASGMIGQSFIHWLPSPWIGETVRALAATAAMILGMHMVCRVPQHAVAHCRMPQTRRTAQWPLPMRLFVQGTAWALIPCSLLYSVLLMAAFSASAISGALLASAFALGGSPVLAVIGWSAARRADATHRHRLAGAWLLLLGTVSLIAILLGGHDSLAGWCALNP